MSVQSRIRKIEKKKGIYRRRKEGIIRCKPKESEKVKFWGSVKKMGFDIQEEKNDWDITWRCTWKNKIDKR